MYIDLVLSSLHELSSIDEQKRLWLSDGRYGKDVSSPIEAAETLFGDSRLDDHLENGDTGFSDEAIDLLRQLDSALLNLDVTTDWAVLINSAEMDEIRGLASKALRAIEMQGSALRSPTA